MINTELKIIEADTGSVFHALKKTDSGYKQFGEVYFSTVKQNVVKAWKLHQRMTLNLVVPVGKVLFCFLDIREHSETYNKIYKIILSQDPYFRLTVPPGIWYGFKGISKRKSMIIAITDYLFDENSVERANIKTFNF